MAGFEIKAAILCLRAQINGGLEYHIVSSPYMSVPSALGWCSFLA